MITLPPEAIRDFLFVGKTTVTVKEYELLCALVLHQFVEMQFKQPCQICFELKEEFYVKGIVKGMATLSEIQVYLSDQVRQDSDVDVGISCGSGVVGFQLKRFGKGKNAAGKDLADYINEMKSKYGSKPRNVKLVVIIESDSEIDLVEMFDKLQMQDYPFAAVMYMGMDSSTQNLHIGELWPQRGFDEYKIINGNLVKLVT